jgi:hypothetical protein
MMKSLRYGILSSPDASLLPPPEPAEDGTVVSVDEVLKEDVLFQLQVGTVVGCTRSQGPEDGKRR